MKTVFQLAVCCYVLLWSSLLTHAQLPELVVQAGHSAGVNSVTFSPDNSLLATSSSDHTVKIWSSDTGQLLRTFRAGGGVACVAWRPDSRILASDGGAGLINLWEAATGKLIRRLNHEIREPFSSIRAIVWSPDGKRLASGGVNEAIRIWNPDSGQLIHVLSADLGSSTADLTWSPDGKFIVDSTMNFWEAATGVVTRTVKGQATIASLAFSPDGRYLADGEGSNVLALRDGHTGELLRELRKPASVHNLSTPYGVAWSPDGQFVAVASSDSTVTVRNIQSGAIVKILRGESPVISVDWDATGQRLASGDRNGEIKLWDFNAGTLLRQIAAPALVSDHLIWSINGGVLGSQLRNADSESIFASSSDVLFWNMATGKPDRHMKLPDAVSSRFAYSADGKFQAGIAYGGIAILDANSAELRKLRDDQVFVVAFNPQGNLVAGGRGDGSIRIWDVATGEMCHNLKEQHGAIRVLAWSPDGKLLSSVIAANTGIIQTWEVAGNKLLYTAYSHQNEGLLDFPSHIQSLAYALDGSVLASGGSDGEINFWSAMTGKFLAGIRAHTGDVNSLAFSGVVLASAGQDGTIKLWNLLDFQLLATLYTFNNDWAVVAPDGRFDTSNPDKIENLHWVLPEDPFHALPIEIFMRQYYEPRLLSRILANEKFKPLPPLATLNRLQPQVRIGQIMLETSDAVTVQVEVARGKGGGDTSVHDVRLFRDGQMVGYNPDSDGEVKNVPAAGVRTLTFEHIKLPHDPSVKQVEFSAYAFNSSRVKSATDRKSFALTGERPPVARRAYVVSFGVNAYESPSWNLNFAANDARQLQATLPAALSKTGRYTEVVPIALVSDSGAANALEARATKANLRTVFDLLAGHAVDTTRRQAIPNADRLRMATPDDFVLLAFACHGYAGDSSQFYLFPTDMGAGRDRLVTADLLHHCISSDELSLWLRDVDAGDMAMIVDACHSAATVENGDFKPGPMDSQGLGQLAYYKGMRILAASQADNVALESNQLRHGLLTYALVKEGIEAHQADYQPHDGSILLDEWMGYGVAAVPALYDAIRQNKLPAGRGMKLEILGDASYNPARSIGQQPSLFDFRRQRQAVLLLRTGD